MLLLPPGNFILAKSPDIFGQFLIVFENTWLIILDNPYILERRMICSVGYGIGRCAVGADTELISGGTGCG